MVSDLNFDHDLKSSCELVRRTSAETSPVRALLKASIPEAVLILSPGPGAAGSVGRTGGVRWPMAGTGVLPLSAGSAANKGIATIATDKTRAYLVLRSIITHLHFQCSL